MMKLRWKVALAALLAPGLMSTAGTASAQANDYYKDKVLNIIIAGSPSGGHSRYARLIEPYLAKHMEQEAPAKEEA